MRRRPRRVHAGRMITTTALTKSFDDTPVATTIWPELTTIRQPVAAMADGAVTMLARIIAAQRGGEAIEAAHSLLDFELIRRDSDAAPGSAATA